MGMRIDKAWKHYASLTIKDQSSRHQIALFNVFSWTDSQDLPICAKHCCVWDDAQIAHIGPAQRSTARRNRRDKLTDVGQQQRAIAN
jgi:hypothetical protein